MDFPPDLVKGSITPLILSLLADRPMYGYEMVKTLNARSNGALTLKEGTLYPALHKLESDGHLEAEWQEDGGGTGSGGGKPRKYYKLTRAGKAELARRAAEYRSFQSHILALLPQ